MCIAGELRTFGQPDVQRSFASLHRHDYEYFVSTDGARPNATLVAPIRAWITGGATGELEGRPGQPRANDMYPLCPARTCNLHRFLLPAVRRLWHCYAAIQREEGARGGRYAWVLRMRPDHMVLRPLPPAARLARSLAVGTVMLWDDQWALAHRHDASTVLLAPSVAYAACADERQWTRACGAAATAGWSIARCRVDTVNYVPCSPMRLITVFGQASRWVNMPLSPRQWSAARAAPTQPGDFCIKREAYTELNRSECRAHSGCMDC